MVPIRFSALRAAAIAVFVLIACGVAISSGGLPNMADNVTFKFFKNNEVVFESRSLSDDLTAVCDPAGLWLMIVPGWTDDCSERTQWIPPLINKFTIHRGGCICCMDYLPYANDPSSLGYINLTMHFEGLSTVLSDKLRHFERQRFAPERGYMFSMSFGSRLAIDAGRVAGGQIAGLDACDPAGPLFYPNNEHQLRGSWQQAARNVQVIHTSIDEGTFERDAHQDWCMGDCGINQPAAPLNDPRFAVYGIADVNNTDPTGLYVPYSRKNHNMCPKFYVSAFEHRFEATANPCCPRTARDANPVPTNYRMGYMQANKERVQGKTLYARTYRFAPYNMPDKNGE